MLVACKTVSTNLDTMERIFNVPCDEGASPVERALRAARVLTAQRQRLPDQLVGRFGNGNRPEYALRLGKGSTPELLEYVLVPSDRKSIGERLFVEELTDVLQHDVRVIPLS